MFGFGRRKLEEKADVPASGVAMPEAWFAELMGGGTATESGESIGPESAMRVPAVLAATRAISETLASLPVQLFRRGADGTRQRDRDHPAAKALDRPNPWTSSYGFKLRLIQDAIKHGRGIAVAARGGGGRIELHIVQHGAMGVTTDVFGEPSYKLNTSTAPRSYAWSDVVDLVPIPADSGGQPLSIVSAAREPIGLAMTLQKHGSRLFKNGARPFGLLAFWPSPRS